MQVSPNIFQRSCGRWLAVAPRVARFSIGAGGATSEEAAVNFEVAWRRWTEIVGNGDGPLPEPEWHE